jgi:uncharacterized membrane protein YgaE (UPF0421/DUF939 family)
VKLPFRDKPRAERISAAARTVAQRTPETLMVVRYRAQPAAFTIIRLAATALLAYGAGLLVPYTTSQPVLAPLTALLVAQVTLYHTVRTAVRRVAAVLIGVLVAVAISAVVAFTWWSLGIVIVAGLIIGFVLRLGDTVLEVPISAMLILSTGRGTEQAAAGRVVETMIGAACGLMAGLVLASPRTESAQQAISELCDKMSALLGNMAAGVSKGAAADAAGTWLDQARALAAEIERVDQAVRQAEDSLAVSPRGRRRVLGQLGLRDNLETLEHAAIIVRGLARSVADLAGLGEEDVPERDQVERDRLSAVLAELSEAVRSFEQLATSAREPAERDSAESALRDHLEAARERQDNLSGVLAADPSERPVGWPLRGELVSHIDRLRSQLESAAGPPHPDVHAHPLARMARRARRGRPHRD